MQRACAGALLHKGTTIITNAGCSEDEKAAMNIVSQLGATVKGHHTNKVEINSSGVVTAESEIDCGESGLSARLFTPIAALSKYPVTVTGKGGLRYRPMKDFEHILPVLGVKLTCLDNHLPVTVHGPLQAKSFVMDASLSSQFLSGILFALSAVAEEQIAIEVIRLSSKPYVDLTLEMLSVFGKNIPHDSYREFYIDPSKFTHQEEIKVDIEVDWSSAAYWFVGAAISGNVTVQNMNLASLQADKAILEVLRSCGCRIEEKENSIIVNSSVLQGFVVDATDCPDLFPILAILAALCEGESSINGLERLVHKESNREKSISAMLTSFGVKYRKEGNSLVISGQQHLNECTIDGYGDHRIIMAGAIGALRASGPVTIEGAAAVGKSYPAFFSHLTSLGIDTRKLS
jgi:3-phosphoshikimate 1-carboxyvinyltransferase